jgi:hypothetical protein
MLMLKLAIHVTVHEQELGWPKIARITGNYFVQRYSAHVWTNL